MFLTDGKRRSYNWHYWPHDNGRSSCGLVGMINLGATCYMASCMQQLYMMPQARAAILNSMVCKLNSIMTLDYFLLNKVILGSKLKGSRIFNSAMLMFTHCCSVEKVL